MSLESINVKDLIIGIDSQVLLDDITQLRILVDIAKSHIENSEFVLYYLEHFQNAIEKDSSLFLNHADRIMQVFSLLSMHKVPGIEDDLQHRVTSYTVNIVQVVMGC